MRLLVTRPVDEAARTAARLTALGHEPVLAPVLDIAPTGAVAPAGPFDLVIATSARALLPAYTVEAPLVCVGEKTAAAGRRAGFSVAATAPDADRLADALLKDASPKTALYLAGRERRADLETRLRAAGWRVDLVEVYAARPVSAWPRDIMSALAEGGIDGILHYSPRSAELAAKLIGAAWPRLAHFCLSPAVARICARCADAITIFTASQPTEECLMTLIGEHRASLGVKTT